MSFEGDGIYKAVRWHESTNKVQRFNSRCYS